MAKIRKCIVCHKESITQCHDNCKYKLINAHNSISRYRASNLSVITDINIKPLNEEKNLK